MSNGLENVVKELMNYKYLQTFKPSSPFSINTCNTSLTFKATFSLITVTNSSSPLVISLYRIIFPHNDLSTFSPSFEKEKTNTLAATEHFILNSRNEYYYTLLNQSLGHHDG